jgi:hypothetical protein
MVAMGVANLAKRFLGVDVLGDLAENLGGVDLAELADLMQAEDILPPELQGGDLHQVTVEEDLGDFGHPGFGQVVVEEDLSGVWSAM